MNPLVKPTIRQLFDKQLRGVPLPGEVIDVPEQDELSYIGRVGSAGMTGLDVADTVLDAPQDATYNAILSAAGRETDPTRIGNRDNEIEGRELLRELGVLRGTKDTYANFGAGLLTDLVVDPWNLVPVGPLTKVGRAATRAGIEGMQAGRMATKAAQAGLDVAPTLTQRATSAAAKAGKDVTRLTDAQIAGRPFVRPRFANRNTTGQNLLDFHANPDKMPGFDQLGEFAKRAENLSPQQLAEPLRRDLGIQLPFMDPLVTFNVPGGGVLGDLIDSATAGAKFSRVGQAVRKKLDKTVGGQDGLDDQVYAAGQHIMGEEAYKRGISEGVTETARLRGSDVGDNIFSEEGNRGLGRLIEQPISYTSEQAAKDTTLSGNANVRHYTDWWDQKKKDLLTRSSEVGVGAEEFSDPNISGYLPRSARNLFTEYAAQNSNDAVNAQNIVNKMTGDQMRRADSMKLPGGRDFIAFDLAKDERLVGKTRLAGSDEEAARIIGEKIEQQLANSVDEAGSRAAAGAYSERDKLELAKLLHRLPPESARQQPLFGQHPTEQISKYIGGREKAIAQGNEELTLIAKSATQQETGEVLLDVNDAFTGGKFKVGSAGSVDYGTKDTLRRMIGETNGIDPSDIALTEWKIPQATFDMINRVKSIESKGPEIRSWMKYFSDTWRNSILTWPSRYARDLMGGALTNLLVIPSRFWNRLAGLYPFAWKMASGGKPPASLTSVVAKMQHYSGMDPAEAVARFQGDLVSTGLMQSTKKKDLGVAGAAVEEALPGYGSDGPMRSIGKVFTGVLATEGEGLPGILRPDSSYAQAGASLGDFTDKVTRIAGYTELMLEGYTPEKAASLLKRAHVDYDSLSDAEKRLRNNYVPFYTFTSRTLQDTGQRLLEQPGKIANFSRIAQAPSQNSDLDGTFVPQVARERVTLNATPDETGSGLNVLYNVDSPLLSALRIGGEFAQGKPDEAIGMLSPTVKMVAENLFGVDSFTGRKLADKRGSLARALDVGRNSPYHKTVQWVDRGIELSPFSRAMQLGKDLSENKDNRSAADLYGTAAINFATGLKRRNFDKSDLMYEAKRTAEEQVGDNLRTFETKYVPKEVLPMLDPRQQRAVTNMKQMEKIRKNISARKAEDRQPRGLFNPLER